MLLSLTEQLPELDDPRALDGVFTKSTLLKHLPEVDEKGGGTPLIKANLLGIEHTLTGLADRAVTPLEIGPYQIAEALAGRPGCRILKATIDNEERLLMMYDLGKNPLEAEQLRTFYLREFSALRKLKDTGIVPEVFEPFPWSDDFLVLPIGKVAGYPLRAYLPPETPEGFVNELLLAAAGFKALSVVHSHGIIHRALGPDSVYTVSTTAEPKVMFDTFYAARLNSRSIADSLNAMAIEDPYAAPELASGYGYSTPLSDCYSLALLFLERFSRVSVSDLTAGPDRRVVFPDLCEHWSSLSASLISEVAKLLESLINRQMDAAHAAQSLTDIARRLKGEVQPDQGQLLDDRYRVIRVLGQGATARTYLARDEEFGNFFALKQYLWPSSVLAHAGNEFDAMRSLYSPYLPRIYDVYPARCDVHVKMDFVQGSTLEEVRPEFPWPIEQWWQFAQHLLNAVEVLERHHLLHRDIKPANIILREADGFPVLIDFGFAVRLGVEAQVAGAPLYLPPEALTSVEPPPSMDRYAVAVVLFEALVGCLPFDTAQNGIRLAVIPATIADRKIRRLAEVLLHAIEENPGKRPPSVEAFRMLLQNAISSELGSEGFIIVNPWVDELRSLYRNSSIGNANNRGLDTDFVRKTYVPTALDTKVLPKLLKELPKVVFLSGNPGDGKTAFLEKVKTELQARGGQRYSEDESGWEWHYEGQAVRSCYDASESNAGQSADEQLATKLTGLEGTNEPAAKLTVLVAINDGRLADFFARYQERFGWLAEQISLAQQYDFGLSSNVWVIDLKNRAFVSASSQNGPSLFGRVLKTLVEPGQWSVCDGCRARSLCPVRSNASALTEKMISDRVEHLFLLSHLRRQRHITIRDLRSALAYLITGNTSCSQVHATLQGEDSSVTLVDRHYWQSAFAPVEGGDELLADLKTLDPARFSQPRLDRLLFFHRTAADAEMRSKLFWNGSDLSPQLFSDDKKWIDAVKRRLYFEIKINHSSGDDSSSSVDQWSPNSLLPYQYASTFVEALTGRADLNAVREAVARGILRSDGVLGLDTEGKLSVMVTSSREKQLTVLKRYPLNEFKLKPVRPVSASMIETIPEALVLSHHSGTPRLIMTIDLFELLMRMADGLQPSAPEFQPLLEDLVPFKSALLLQQTRDLVLVENQRQLHFVTQRDGKIVRTRSAMELLP